MHGALPDPGGYWEGLPAGPGPRGVGGLNPEYSLFTWECREFVGIYLASADDAQMSPDGSSNVWLFGWDLIGNCSVNIRYNRAPDPFRLSRLGSCRPVTRASGETFRLFRGAFSLRLLWCLGVSFGCFAPAGSRLGVRELGRFASPESVVWLAWLTSDNGQPDPQREGVSRFA